MAILFCGAGCDASCCGCWLLFAGGCGLVLFTGWGMVMLLIVLLAIMSYIYVVFDVVLLCL